MNMPGRKFSAGTGYRYGFNGKELDTDAGVVQYDYGFRIYDARIGRFKSVDPLFRGYAWNSPYSYAEGDVIRCVDLDGLEKAVFTDAGTIEIQFIVVAFTNRPSKVIDGKTLSGGNLPLGLNPDLAVKLFNKAYEEVNAGLNGKEFALKFIEMGNPELAKTLYHGAQEGGSGDKTYKIRYNAKLLVFTDEEEMNKSEEVKAAMDNNLLSGYQLYGSESYAKIGKDATSDQSIALSEGAAAESFGKGTTQFKAVLIRTFDENPNSSTSSSYYTHSRVIIVHEQGHQLGVNNKHIEPSDPVVNPIESTHGRYNGVGMMRYLGGSRKAEAPFVSQIVKMLSFIRFEKPKSNPERAPHTDSIKDY